MVDKVELKSLAGQKLFRESKKSHCQQLLVAVFCKQPKAGTCGLHSCALLMAAEQLGKHLGTNNIKDSIRVPPNSKPKSEDELFKSENTKLHASNCYYSGTTLDQVSAILTGYGYKAKVVHAKNVTVDEFRQQALDVLSHTDSKEGIIINFKKKALGFSQDWGHHSPLAAYHRESDRFLIMDTSSSNNNGEWWVKTEDIHMAMCAGVDAMSNKSRGYCIMGKS